VQQNAEVSFPLRGAFALMIVLLAGCVSAPRQNIEEVDDWEDVENRATNNSPIIATAQPTPTNPPAPPPKGAAPDQNEPGTRARETWVRLQEWTRSRGLASPVRLSSGPSSSYAVKSTNGV